MFIFLSGLCTLIVFFALCYLAIKQTYLLVKPSTLFLVFFFLQVQLSSAIHADSIVDQLDNPWIYFLLIHIFSILCLGIVFFFKRRTARKIFDDVGTLTPMLSVKILGMMVLFLLILIYIIVFFYLSVVPFRQTGFYAAFFKPEMLDIYRQLSFTLLSDPILRYTFTLLTKVLAPITGTVCVVLGVIAWKRKFYKLSLFSWISLILTIWPAMLYGARGPGAMVALAAAFAWFLVFKRKVTLTLLLGAVIFVFTPPVIIQMAKSPEISLDRFIFQSGNMLDRAMGRSYVDNVRHLVYVQENGFTGIAAIEKIAKVIGIESVDSFNNVANQFTSDSIKCDQKNDENCRKVMGSGSASASFVIMNYTMFGMSSLLFSLAFIFFIDMFLWLYCRVNIYVLFAAVSAEIVPVLSLSFSLFTTVLASKGLLLIPFICLFLGKAVNRIFRPEFYLCSR